MKIFVATSVGEIPKKEKWFGKKICEILRKKGVEFGFEIKDSVAGFEEFNYPFGFHLPKSFANNWRNNGGVLEKTPFKPLNNLKPEYVVLHGLKIIPQRRGVVSDEDYSDAFLKMVKLMKQLIEFGLPAAVENAPVIDFVKENGSYLPKTFLHLRVPTSVPEMINIRRRTGCRLVIDVEHLAMNGNFFRSIEDNKSLPADDPKNVTTYGQFFNRYGSLISHDLSYLKEVEVAWPNIFHITGCCSDGTFKEVKTFDSKEVVGHHDLIEDNPYFEKIIQTMLERENITIVQEVSGPNLDQCFAHRSEDVEEKSFETLCTVLNRNLQAPV